MKINIINLLLILLLNSCNKAEMSWNLKRVNPIDFNGDNIRIYDSMQGFSFERGTIIKFDYFFEDNSILILRFKEDELWKTWSVMSPIISIDGVDYYETFMFGSVNNVPYFKKYTSEEWNGTDTKLDLSCYLVKTENGFSRLKFVGLVSKGYHNIVMRFNDLGRGKVDKIEFWKN